MASNYELFPGYQIEIPTDIVAPDTVETSVGTLNLDDGRPVDETAAKLNDFRRTS